jgi:hypothetical protein
LESNAIATPLVLPLLSGTDAVPEDGDPDLRSTDAIIGYHIAATDGEIGHVKGFLVDDADWRLRYMTVDTKNWLPGRTVLLSPRQIDEIDWSDKRIRVDVDREKIKLAPLYDPQMTSDVPYNDRFHAYFGLTIRDREELKKPKIGA